MTHEKGWCLHEENEKLFDCKIFPKPMWLGSIPALDRGAFHNFQGDYCNIFLKLNQKSSVSIRLINTVYKNHKKRTYIQ